jgi:hypothetical protein
MGKNMGEDCSSKGVIWLRVRRAKSKVFGGWGEEGIHCLEIYSGGSGMSSHCYQGVLSQEKF